MSFPGDLISGGATTLSNISNTIRTVGSSVASGLNAIQGVVGAVEGGVAGILAALSGADAGQVNVPGIKLPLKNPLFSYASYTYVLSISALSAEDLNHPDTSYRIGKRLPLLCKSANADPSNRVQLPFGKFDFFIDNLDLTQVIGMEKGNNTNVTNISFKITEPYSMGMFFLAAQQLAMQVGHTNWNNAPFLLSIEFRGNKETGQIEKIRGTSRYIPFKFTDIDMTVNQEGSVYSITALPYNQEALADGNAKFKSDHSVSGSTVQEMLQTGEKSLQVVINKKLKDIAKKNKIPVPDQVVILFPKNTASDANISAGETETVDSATTTPTELLKQIGVSEITIGKSEETNLAQDASTCNAIGSAGMGFDEKRKGAAPMGKDGDNYDKDKGVYVRANNNVDPKQSDMKFRQDTDITNAINQVVLMSNFVDQALDPTALSPDGFRGWWRIDVQTFMVPTNANDKVTGQRPKILVYRVVPYQAHAGNLMPVNTRPPGLVKLNDEICKEYNYLYTGKNQDVRKFDIHYQSNFMNVMSADGLVSTQDNKTKASTGAVADTEYSQTTPLGEGNAPEQKLGILPTVVKFIGTLTKSDKFGGGGSETQSTRAARLFQDSITKANGTDMIELNLEIYGDPYYIAQSGMGNYTSKPTQFKNLNYDGSMNYQNGEVHIRINFRTPSDLDQTTGLYTFKTGGVPIIQFSGLYRVTNVSSKFNNGEFHQTLVGTRIQAQESGNTATPEKIYSTAKQIAAADPNTPSDTASESGPTASYNADGTVNAADANGYGEG